MCLHDIEQLVAHLPSKQTVTGSNPVIKPTQHVLLALFKYKANLRNPYTCLHEYSSVGRAFDY